MGMTVSEARDRLTRAVAVALANGGPIEDEWNAALDVVDHALLAHPADLIAVLETLTCEECSDGQVLHEGTPEPIRRALGAEPDHTWENCPACNGSGRDSAKVQAVLRQFADAGVLTEEFIVVDADGTSRGYSTWAENPQRLASEGVPAWYDAEYPDRAPHHREHHFVGPWVPLGAPE